MNYISTPYYSPPSVFRLGSRSIIHVTILEFHSDHGKNSSQRMKNNDHLLPFQNVTRLHSAGEVLTKSLEDSASPKPTYTNDPIAVRSARTSSLAHQLETRNPMQRSVITTQQTFPSDRPPPASVPQLSPLE